jgi:Tol biopolymer transport system component
MINKIRKAVLTVGPCFALAALFLGSIVSASHFGPWQSAVSMEASTADTHPDFNTAFNDGCPYQAPDGLSFYMASNRPGGFGGQDIWIATRASANDAWGAPVNAGEPINSAFDDFCPTPVRGHGLFFVSARPHPDGCGGPDIYFSRLTQDGWTDPGNLGCQINSSAGEASPSYFEDDNGNEILYFSSNQTGGFALGGSDSDIYYSVNFGPAQLVPGINSAQEDFRPNVQKDGREIVFDSNRPGGFGGQDIWTSLRESTADGWAAAENLGPAINSASNETRASLSWDAEQLVFGTDRPGVEGQADIFVSTRTRTKTRFSGFSAAQPVGPPINSVDDDNSPFLAPNGLSLYFSGARAGGFGSGDIWVSHRATPDSPWETPQNIGPVINTSGSDNTPSLSPDGLTMFFNSNKPGGVGGQDIYLSTRTDPNDDFGWSAPVNLGPLVNSPLEDGGTSYFEDPATGIGVLYFIAIRPGGFGDYDIYQSTRNPDGSFNPPTNVTPLNSSARDARPVIRPDGLEMFFASARAGGLGDIDLYVSTRASIGSPWNPPVNLTALNTSSTDGAPAISPDGSVIYFASNRPGGSGLADLYFATRKRFGPPL